MKTSAISVISAIGVLLLSGCASTGTAYQQAPPQPQSQVVDGQYVATVEKIARQRGTRVVWVNMPTRRVSTTVVAY